MKRNSITIPTEHQEQVIVTRYCDINMIPMFAIPNGTNKSLTARSMFKAEGLRAGVPDICIPIPNKYYHHLYIELKRARKQLKNGKTSVSHTKVSPEQKKWIEKLREEGSCAVVAYGAKEAIEIIEDYMENKKWKENQ